MGQNELIEVAKKLLGQRELEGIIQWYDEALSSNAKFVVFVVRRSYILATLMEKITGNEMKDSKERSFVTDSAFLLCCENLAEYYRQNKCFPSIFVCDDILIHGRNLNRIIKNIEDSLFELLQDEDDEQTIRDALAEAIQINVYCYATGGTLKLRNRYRKNTKCFVKYEPVRWRELSSHISSLIVESGVANASYINSEVICKDNFERICENEYRKHFFQNVDGFTKVRFLQNENNQVYAICTLRLLKNKINDWYRVIPFVFMPNLDEQETEVLFDGIERVAITKGYSSEYFDEIRKLNRITGKRMFNEWITLLVSQTMLQEFRKEMNCVGCFRENEVVEDFEYEIRRLIRNYKFSLSERSNLECFLRKCLRDVPIFSSIDELDSVLKESNMQRPILTLVDDGKTANTVESIDNYFYNKGYEEELETLQDTWDADSPADVSRRTVRGGCFVFKELLSGANSEQAKEMVSRFLFLMDAGVLALASLAPSDVTVVGFAQFAKAGEQSLLLEPIKYMEFIPFLSIAHEWSTKLGDEYEKHLSRYFSSDFCDISDELQQKLMTFVEKIKRINQNVEDWNGNYFEKMDREVIHDGDSLERQYKLEEKRMAHIDHYQGFLTALMKNM